VGALTSKGVAVLDSCVAVSVGANVAVADGGAGSFFVSIATCVSAGCML